VKLEGTLQSKNRSSWELIRVRQSIGVRSVRQREWLKQRVRKYMKGAEGKFSILHWKTVKKKIKKVDEGRNSDSAKTGGPVPNR